MGKRASVRFLLNARQATAASNVRGAGKDWPNRPASVLQTLGISLLESACPSNFPSAFSRIGIAAPLEYAISFEGSK